MPAILPVHPTPAGIYIHVPFCMAKCPYCDFYSITDLKQIPDYLDALLLEINQCQVVLPAVDTIYFGGGTPSTLSPRQIERVLDTLCDRFPVDPAAEITLEMNPGTADRKKLSGYRAAGIGRLNIGLQSLNDQTLRWLGRIHDVRQGLDAFRWARAAGFDNIGLDLIYGIPGQTEKKWAVELSAAVEIGAEHLSCYTLTLEPGTPLSMKVEKGRVTPLDEDTTGTLFSFTSEFLSHHGYRQYEVSNYARVSDSDAKDYRSRHNRKYWTFAPYLGFGPAAHSFMDNRRWWNHRSLDAYLNAINSGQSPIAETETLSPEQQIMEYIYLGLRQTQGIDTIDFESRFELSFYRWYEHEISLLLNEELLEIHHQYIRTTARGMRFLDQVVDRLIG
ncbi:HemN: oxygen-independent coproporphyrinogen-III oxidase 1 (coproporphyrinogenase) [Desulfosarcina variabilis str. Montpellier]|uniref:radical SAM family heme chaperone HemW n=1 Tax=Desulfosarcina variabilis TaxID=2300 RepID=UPI003AFA36F6